jgi:hypothetical protein
MKAMVAVTKQRRIKRGCGIFLMLSMRFEMLAELFVRLEEGKGWKDEAGL